MDWDGLKADDRWQKLFSCSVCFSGAMSAGRRVGEKSYAAAAGLRKLRNVIEQSGME